MPGFLVLAACLLSVVPEPQEPGSVYGAGWSAVHADAANSDYHPHPGPGRLALAWSRRFGGMINLGPTSDDRGRLYVTTSGPGCRLHALDRATGETVWCSAAPDRLAVASSPLIDRDGVLYLGDGRAMHAFDPAGRSLWRTPITGVALWAQFTPAGDLLFVTHVGVVYLLDRETGATRAPPLFLVPDARFNPADGARACMRGEPGCPAANTPAMDLRTGRFFFTFWAPGAARAGVRAMRVVGGPPGVVPEWVNDALPGGSASSPTLSADGSRLYVTDNAGGLHALAAATGDILWSVDIGSATSGSVSVSPEGLIMPAGGATAALMAVQDRGSFGEVIWRRSDLLNRGIAAQAQGGLAYATVARGEGRLDLVIVDARTGESLDTQALPGRPRLTVGTTLDRGGAVYAPTLTGDLHAFHAE